MSRPLDSPAAPVAPGSATVVIAQRVRPEREGEYLAWQAEIGERCRAFAGFERAEVVPPVSGFQDDFVVVFQFDTFEHLDAWLRSDVRRALLERGAPLFAGEARQHTVAGARPVARPAGMVVTTRVKPGSEPEFQAWEDSINAAAARFPGFLGNEVFAPVAGVQEEWVVVVRFDSTEHLEGWRRSDVRQRLIDQAARLWDEASVETISGGFPGWFASGPSTPGAPAFPPEWKQAMIVLLALYPTVMLITYLLTPRLASLPMAVGMFVGNAVSVSALTWLLMPLVNRGFGFWLTPAPARRTRAEVLGIGAVLVGYAVLLIAFLALER